MLRKDDCSFTELGGVSLVSSGAARAPQLREELERLSPKALRKRAIDSGVEEKAVQAAERGSDTQAALIKEIVKPHGDTGGAFNYRQVLFVYMPDMNFLISIDGTGQKDWSNVHKLISNPRCLVRQEQQVTTLLSALIDSMVDEMYPLLDFYAEALTGLCARPPARPPPARPR